MMKIHQILLVFLAVSSSVLAAPTHVRGHIDRRTGTYVAPHVRTAPDHTRLNNYSTKGNVNPYTGKAGTKSPLPAVGH